MVIWFIKSFFVYFFCVFLPPHLNLFCFCYVFNVSSFIMPILAWNIPFLEEISNLSILLFSSISLHCSLKKAFLSLLAILWNSAFTWVYLSFLLCLSLFFFPQLFVKPLQTTTFPSCISFSLGTSWSPLPVQCYKSPSIVLQTLVLPDWITWTFSPPSL